MDNGQCTGQLIERLLSDLLHSALSPAPPPPAVLHTPPVTLQSAAGCCGVNVMALPARKLGAGLYNSTTGAPAHAPQMPGVREIQAGRGPNRTAFATRSAPRDCTSGASTAGEGTGFALRLAAPFSCARQCEETGARRGPGTGADRVYPGPYRNRQRPECC